MGAPVFKFGAFQQQNSLGLFEFYPAATVRWKSTILTFRSSFLYVPTSTTIAGANCFLQVNGVAVAEFRIFDAYNDIVVLVIPWGDGIRFTNGEKVTWSLDIVSSFFVSVTFIGEED